MIRIYFDIQTGSCQFFKYTGCDGNRNNFLTQEDCNRVCGDFQSKLIRLLCVRFVFAVITMHHDNIGNYEATAYANQIFYN